MKKKMSGSTRESQGLAGLVFNAVLGMRQKREQAAPAAGVAATVAPEPKGPAKGLNDLDLRLMSISRSISGWN